MKNYLDGKKLEKFVSIQNFLVPRSKTFNEIQRKESTEIINDFIATKPDIIAHKITLFFVLIDLFSVLLNFKTFTNLSIEKKEKLMHFLFDNNIPILRKGFWGINTLCKLGVYSQSSIYPDIGYKLREINE